MAEGNSGEPFLPGRQESGGLLHSSVMEFGEHSVHHNATREYPSGYTLSLTDDERAARSRRAKDMDLAGMGRAAIQKATGGDHA